jgi:hypothetical protein
MFLRSEQVVILYVVRVLFLFFCVRKTSYAFQCNGKHTHFVIYILLNVAYAFGTWNLNTKKTKVVVKMCYRKLYRSGIPELTAERAKLKITIIRTRKSAETIKSERSGTIMRDMYVPNVVWLQQALQSCVAFIFTTSVPTRLNRHTNFYFFVNGKRALCVCVCVCVCVC